MAQQTQGDVQQTLRLSCPADASMVDTADRASHARWFRYFPQSRPYFEQLNFRLYRLSPRRFHYNGGFAAARWLGKERLLRESPLDDSGEIRLLEALQDLPDRLTRPAGRHADPMRLAGVDPWGLDLAQGACLHRLALPGPLTTVESLRIAAQAAWNARVGALDC